MPNLPSTAKISDTIINGWSGHMPSVQRQIDVYARIGQAGSGYQVTGTRADDARISGWIGAATSVQAFDTARTLEGYQGQVASVIDDFGKFYPRVRVDKMSTSIRAGYGPALTSGTQMLYLVSFDCTLEVLP